MEIWRRKRGFAEASEREREVLIQNSSAPHFLPPYQLLLLILLANLSFEGLEGRVLQKPPICSSPLQDYKLTFILGITKYGRELTKCVKWGSIKYFILCRMPVLFLWIF